MSRPSGGFSFLHLLIYITKEICVISFFLNVLVYNVQRKIPLLLPSLPIALNAFIPSTYTVNYT